MNQNRGASVCSSEQARGGRKRENSDPVRREIGELAGDGDEGVQMAMMWVERMMILWVDRRIASRWRRKNPGLLIRSDLEGRSASYVQVGKIGLNPAPRVVEEERFDVEETVPAQLREGAVVTVVTALTLSLLSLSQNFESSRKRVSISKTRRRRSSVRERR
ncbi:hypothetical protein PIB30_101887 [Stylosanthes scabra]|uniref:Uncharacterized protein n=1 Tax=Stylosanthes scabra TaxID=79078 RepID=A0ABU6WXI8_9FABA|nr:hypothetical protein [Stylosanthes scabra]